MIMDIYDGKESMKNRPMKGFIQVLQVLLFFVIPVRVKYFGFFAAALWVLSFLGAPLPQKLSLLLSMANVWLFFGPMAYRSVRAWVRREQWKRRNRR